MYAVWATRPGITNVCGLLCQASAHFALSPLMRANNKGHQYCGISLLLLYVSPLGTWRLEAAFRKLALGGGGNGPEGGGAGRIGKTVVELKLSVSFERCCEPFEMPKESLSLERSGSTTGLLDVRGGKNGRSNEDTGVEYALTLVPFTSVGRER